eukprot:360180-Chlamydomonas_euryale.AAC.9
MRPGPGRKFWNGSSALMRHSIAWPENLMSSCGGVACAGRVGGCAARALRARGERLGCEGVACKTRRVGRAIVWDAVCWSEKSPAQERQQCVGICTYVFAYSLGGAGRGWRAR